MSELFRNILLTAKDSGQTISLWIYRDLDSAWCGKVVDLNEEVVLLKHFTKYGDEDGFVIEKISNIESVELEDDYLKGLDYLISTKSPQISSFEFILDKSNDWLSKTLTYFKVQHKIIFKIAFDKDNERCGFLIDFDEHFVYLHSIDSSGLDIGKTIVKLEDVQGFKFDDLDCRKRNLLYNWRKVQD